MKNMDDVMNFSGYEILNEHNESELVAEATERATRIRGEV
jgi:hypothetical protein